MKREFAREGLGYVLRIRDMATEFRVERIYRSRDGIHGELAVTCGLPATRSHDGNLHQARFNLSSTTARTTLARVLTGRANIPDIDWLDLLEELCRHVLAAERQGMPVEDVGALPVALEETYRLRPALPENQVTFVYGDFGTGKSTLVSAMAVSVQSGAVVVDGWVPRQAPVLYLDWEAGKHSINRRVRGVAMGAHIPGVITIRYLDCRRRGPLYTFAEEIARLVDQDGYGLVIVDSVGMAAGTSGDGGDANETTLRLFTAFGYIGTTIIGVDHITKADAADPTKPAKQYGSMYKGALARMTFEIRRTQAGDGRQVLGVYNRKSNDAAELPPLALAVDHRVDGSIAYQALETLPVDLTRSLSQTARIAAAFAELGDSTDLDDLVEVTGIAAHTLRTVLNRRKTDYYRLPSGKWSRLQRVS